MMHPQYVQKDVYAMIQCFQRNACKSHIENILHFPSSKDFCHFMAVDEVWSECVDYQKDFMVENENESDNTYVNNKVGDDDTKSYCEGKQVSIDRDNSPGAEIKTFFAVSDLELNTMIKPDETLGNELENEDGGLEESCENSCNDKTDSFDDYDAVDDDYNADDNVMLELPGVSDIDTKPIRKTKENEGVIHKVKRKRVRPKMTSENSGLVDDVKPKRGRPKKSSEDTVKHKYVKKENEEEIDLEWKPRMNKVKLDPTRIHKTRKRTKELNESVEPDPETKAKLDRLLIRKRATPRDKTKLESENKIKRPVGRPKEIFDSSYVTEENRQCMVEYKENGEDDDMAKDRPKKYVFLRTRIECKYCHKSFMSYHLPIHVKKVHGEKEGCVRCDICYKWIPAHRKRDHDRDIHDISKPRLHGEPTHQCDKCGIVMKKENKYQHEKCHALGQPHTRGMVCEVCGIVCSSLMTYTAHSRKHSKTKYICDQMDCNFVCISRAELKKHKARHEASIPCSICGKLFISKTYVKKHIRSVHMQEKSHKCSQCFKSFNAKFNMLKHFQEQHTGVCYTCSTCGRIFKHESSLQKHLPIHTGYRKYVCHVCNHSSIQSTPFWAHMKKKHGLSKEEAAAIHKKHIAEQNEGNISQS